MGLPQKVLGADEHVVIHTRTHVKAMLLPALAFVLIAAAVGVGAALIPHEARPIGQFAILVLGVVLAVWLVLLPFLRWRTTTYTITNRRLITRSGILNKVGKDLPLNRINDVSHERSLMDRILGCGSLIVQTAAEDGTIVLKDVPDVEHVNLQITQLLFGPQHGSQNPPAPRS
ncbi:MAG TPA: PH domain-containing protein [Propionibacteriaceae bacterium]